MQTNQEKGFKKTTQITRFLFVTNIVKHETGTKAQAFPDYDKLQNVFSKYSTEGKKVEIIKVPNKPFANIIFNSTQNAHSAYQALNKIPCEDYFNLKMHIEFSEPRSATNKPFKNRIECISKTISDPNPSGLYIIDNFLSQEEEEKLIKSIDSSEQISDFSRKVQHYGYEFDYKTRSVDTRNPLPSIPNFLLNLKLKLKNFSNEQHSDLTSILNKISNFDQITINEYIPGNGIRPHVDTHSSFSDVIASISLCADIVMRFANPNNEKHKLVLLKPGSLTLMSGEARYLQNHSISFRKNDRIFGKLIPRKRRISITLRCVRKSNNKCNCKQPETCDSIQAPEQLINSDNFAPTNIEKQYVHSVYDSIAEHFSHTRYRPQPQVENFLKSVSKGSIIVDIGCGNGKYLPLISSESTISGIDRCVDLVKIAKKHKRDVIIGDALTTPYRSNIADVSISIAVLHHFSLSSHRLQCVKELVRITRPGGDIFLCAQAFEQEKDSRHNFVKQDCLVPWNLFKVYRNKEAEKINNIEGVIDDETGSIQLKRFCHVFVKNEIESLFIEVGNCKIIESGYERGNQFVHAKKLI